MISERRDIGVGSFADISVGTPLFQVQSGSCITARIWRMRYKAKWKSFVVLKSLQNFPNRNMRDVA